MVPPPAAPPDSLAEQVEPALRFEHAVVTHVHEHVMGLPEDSREAEALLDWARERLLASELVTGVELSGSFARGTAIRPFHDIDSLVSFDLEAMRSAGLHEGSNLAMHLVHTIIDLLVPHHEIVHGSSWAFATKLETGGVVSVRRQRCSVGACYGTEWTEGAVTLDLVPIVASARDVIQVLHRDYGATDTNPKVAAEEVERLDTALDGTFRPLVQLAKRWNLGQALRLGDADLRPFKSFHLELLCAEFARQELLDGSTGDGAPLLHEAFTDLLVYLRMRHRFPVPVPGTGSSLGLERDRLPETTRVLRETSQTLHEARRSIACGELEKAAEHWREVLGPAFVLPADTERPHYRPRWQRTMSRRRARGPLHWAAETGTLHGLDATMTDGATPYQPQVEGALAIASALDHVEVVAWILDHFHVGSSLLGRALTIACMAASTEVFTLLCEHDSTDVEGDSTTGETPLQAAAMFMDAPYVDQLLRRGADPNRARADGLTALHLAAHGGNDEVAECLLQAGAAVDVRSSAGTTALFITAERDNAGAMEMLLVRGADPCSRDSNGNTPLYAACATGSARAARVLLGCMEVRRTANASMANGFSPLVMAAIGGHLGVVEVLVAIPEVDVHASCDAGWTALGFAVQEGRLEVAQRLIAAGASVEATRLRAARPEEIGSRPLLTAANNGHLEMVALLLRAGADVAYEAPGHHLDALGAAIVRGHHQIVARLIESGADVNRRMREPFVSPLVIACVQGHPHIARALLDAGADPSGMSEGRHVPAVEVEGSAGGCE